MTKLDLTVVEIFIKAEAAGIGQNTVEYIEKELETKLCTECCHLFDPGTGETSEDALEDMMFCSHCGGELEENTNFDQVNADCVCCGGSLLEDEEGYVTKDGKQGVCYECYDSIPEEFFTPEEIEEKEKARANYKPVRMITSSQLAGKSITRSYHVEWNGTHVVHTADNCICASYSDYDMFTGKTSHHHIMDVNDFYRLCK